jgi:hypothetical protein
MQTLTKSDFEKTFISKKGNEYLFFFGDNFVPNYVEVTSKNGNWICGVGLEFDGITLVGYDEVFQVPEFIITQLEFMGYNIDL